MPTTAPSSNNQHHHHPTTSSTSISSTTSSSYATTDLNSMNGVSMAVVGNRRNDSLPTDPYTTTAPSQAATFDEQSSSSVSNSNTRSRSSFLDQVKTWDTEQVSRWLTDSNVGQYADLFQSQDILGNVLLDVDQTALKEMGVRSVGDRVKIIVAIKNLRMKCLSAARGEQRQQIHSRNGSGGPLSPLGAGLSRNGSLASSMGSIRRPVGAGRIPPPLHLSQSNSSSTSTDLPQAWQSLSTPNTANRQNSTSGHLTSNSGGSIPNGASPRSGLPASPRAALPLPSLGPPRALPPLTYTRDVRTGSPVVPDRRPLVPANPGRSQPGLGQSRSGSSISQQQQQQQPQHRKTNSGGSNRLYSTPSASSSSQPYTSQSPTTSDGFINTSYGRALPSTTQLQNSTKALLLPSPAFNNNPLLSPVSELSDSPRSVSSPYSASRNNFHSSSASTPPTTTTPNTGGSQSSLDAVMRKAIKFIGTDGVSKMIAVSDCGDGREVLERVLKKFTGGAEEDLNGWGVFSSGVDGLAHLLSESELFSICRDGLAPERQRGLIVRRLHQSTSSMSRRPSQRLNKLQRWLGESDAPDSRRPGGSVSASSPTSPNYLGVEIPSTMIEPASPSTSSPPLAFGYPGNLEQSSSSLGSTTSAAGLSSERKKTNRASTISVLSGLGADWATGDSSDGRNSRSGNNTGSQSPSSGSIPSRKLRNFFGQRPPSELIATHLTDYFPKAEKNKLLSKQVRQSVRRSIVRRDSQYSAIGDTSWDQAPDRYSLSPASSSRFSGSSHGSSSLATRTRSSQPLPPPPPVDKDFAFIPPLGFGSGTGRKPSSIVEEEESIDPRSKSTATAAVRNSLASRRLSRISVANSRLSGLSAWSNRLSRDLEPSETGGVLTVDEVTAEVEARRESIARRESLTSYAGSDDESENEGVEMRPPSISLSIEEEDEEEESEEESEEDEEEEEHVESEALPVAENKAPRKKWIKGALIGAGSFGSVYLGMDPMSGSLMAVKQVELPTGHSHNEERKKSMLDALEREIELLKVLQHENIVQYLDSSSDNTHLNIFLEYVPGGSVAALLSNYGAFEEALVSKFVKQILTGLDYLHEREIIHRDIKGANILVDNKGGIKISDFGISKKVEDNLLTGSKVHRPSLQGSVYWMAPEVVKQTSYTSKADIWSLGCLVVEMLTGIHPWANLTQMQAIFRIGSSIQPTIPDDISSSAEDFLEHTFLIDHSDRPSAKVLLQHEFIESKESAPSTSGEDGGFGQQTPTRANFGPQGAGSPKKE